MKWWIQAGLYAAAFGPRRILVHMSMSPGRTRRFMWSMAIVVALVNLPLLNSLWTSSRLDSDGVDVTAEVLETRRVESTGDHWVTFRFDEAVDPDGTAWPARVDETAYDEAAQTRRIGVRVLPDRPAAHRVEGTERGNAGLVTTLVVDGLVLLVALLWWLRRGRTRRDEQPAPDH